jgi:hypothetical protein
VDKEVWLLSGLGGMDCAVLLLLVL